MKFNPTFRPFPGSALRVHDPDILGGFWDDSSCLSFFTNVFNFIISANLVACFLTVSFSYLFSGGMFLRYPPEY